MWHTSEKTGWCDIHQRILGSVTCIREKWVVGHTLENSGLCDIHWRIGGCVTYIRENWVVWHTSENFGLCEIHWRNLGGVTYARTHARTHARTPILCYLNWIKHSQWTSTVTPGELTVVMLFFAWQLYVPLSLGWMLEMVNIFFCATILLSLKMM